MEIKDMIKEGTAQLKNVASMVQEKVQEKVQDKELREKVEGVIRETAKSAADLTVNTLQKTKEYMSEINIMPGSKDEYIEELERTIEEKDREIARLERLLKRSKWTGSRR